MDVVTQEEDLGGLKANVLGNLGVALGLNLLANGGIVIASKVLRGQKQKRMSSMSGLNDGTRTFCNLTYMKKIAGLGEAKEKLLCSNASRGVDVQLLALGLPLIECRDHVRIDSEKSREKSG